MIRVNAEKLVSKNNKYYFDDNEFDGIAYWVISNGEVKAFYCVEGVKTEEYKSEFLPYDKITLFIHDSYLEDSVVNPYDQICYKGEVFNGLCYDFGRDGVCVGETEFKNGQISSSVGYDFNRVKFLNLYEQNISQNYQWNSDGVLLRLKISMKNSFEFFLQLSEKNEITNLTLDGDPFAKLPRILHELKFNLFSSLDEIKHLNFAKQVFLSGDGIDDHVFDSFFKNNCCEKLNELVISKTSLTVKSFELVKRLTNLRKLIVSPEPPMGFEKIDFDEFNYEIGKYSVTFSKK